MKKFFIVFFVIIVLIGAALFIAVDQGEKILERTVNSYEGLSLTSAKIDLFTQTIALDEVAYSDGETLFTSSSVKIHVVREQLMDLLFMQTKELYSVNLELENMIYGSVIDRIHTEFVEVSVEGTFSLTDIESSVISHIEAYLEEPRMIWEEGNVSSFSGESSDIAISGHFDKDTSFENVQELIPYITDFSFSLNKPLIEVGENPDSFFQMLTVPNEVAGEILSFSAYKEQETLYVDECICDLSIISMEGALTALLVSPVEFSLSLDVNFLDDSIRSDISLPLMFLGYSIPQGPFTINAQQVEGKGPLDVKISEK